jgi:hypothetical protein
LWRLLGSSYLLLFGEVELLIEKGIAGAERSSIGPMRRYWMCCRSWEMPGTVIGHLGVRGKHDRGWLGSRKRSRRAHCAER